MGSQVIEMTQPQSWIMVTSVAFVSVCTGALLISVRADVVCAPQMIATAQAALLARVDRIEGDARPALANAASLAKDGQDTLDALYPDLQGSADSATVAITSVAQASQAVRDAMPKVAASAVQAVGAVTTLEVNTRPVLTNAAALVLDAQDTLDALYPDIQGSADSATVAITSVAQAAQAVRDAAPKVAASVESSAASVAEMAADGKREVDAITAPKTPGQKAVGVVPLLIRIALAIW
jgi:hypothetical protein